MNKMKYYIYWLIFMISSLGIVSGVDKKIPFPKALADASIKVNNLNDILDGALIIGNGDINALIYSDSNSIVLLSVKGGIPYKCFVLPEVNNGTSATV